MKQDTAMARTTTTTVCVFIASVAASLSVGPAGASGAVPRFSAPVPLDVGSRPQDIVAADLNRDAEPDLVTVDYGSATVSVLLGRGDGSFRHRSVIHTARHPLEEAVADLDGDGRLDIATASVDDAGSVSVFLARPSGRFEPAGAYATHAAAESIAAADLNGDGLADLLTANASPDEYAVLMGTGGGRFAPARVEPGDGAADVAIGDLDHDGHDDLALASGKRSLTVRLGAGDGTFGAPSVYPTAKYPYNLTLADLDQDGSLDMAVASESASAVTVFRGTGAGTFGPASRYPMDGDTPLVGDFDADGKLDVATASLDLVVRGGNGDGTFGPKQVAFRYPYPLVTLYGAVADFNGDGRPDVASSGFCDPVELFGCRVRSAFVFLNWTGDAAPPCTVPDVRHWTPRAARRMLRQAGCRLGRVSRRIAPAHKGYVLAQSPRYGSVRAALSPVDIVVARGRH
jgi:hypothetical protein